jgi:FAD/FMN-containing dehydrogenase
MSAVAPSVIEELRGKVKGRVLLPEDAGSYDESRAVYFGGFDRRPAAIAMVADAADVASVLSVARHAGLPLAVRAGGHSNAGHSVCEGGIVLHLGELRAIDVDARARAVWAGAGLSAGDLTTALGAHGGAVTFGDGHLVGIAGLTLGGGVGLLSRKHGMTIDSLTAADVVTADGELLRTDETSHPDLFWAIRGGGGNFGVVTRFQYRLADVDRVLGGILVLPATADVVARLIEALATAPEDLTAIVNVQTAPPAPFIPKEHHGTVVTWINLVHLGAQADAERAVARLRALAPPIADTVRPMRYPEILPPQVAMRPLVVQHMRHLDTFARDMAATIVDALNASSAPVRVVQLRVLGGAVSRVPNDATAYAHRDRPMMLMIAAMYQDASQTAAHQRWVDELGAALPKRPGAYVNFMKDEGAQRVREAYPGRTWDRLVAAKRRYDPTNLFRLNQNVPAAE